MALASYPGFSLTAPPSNGQPYGQCSPPATSTRDRLPHVAVLPDGTRVDIAPSTLTQDLEPVDEPERPEPLPPQTSLSVPLGTIAGGT